MRCSNCGKKIYRRITGRTCGCTWEEQQAAYIQEEIKKREDGTKQVKINLLPYRMRP